MNNDRLGIGLPAPYAINPLKGKIRPACRIAADLGIKAVKLPRSSEVLQGRAGMTEIHCVNGELKKYIIVAEELPIEERRLTLTHELAHCFLGHLLDDEFHVPYAQQEFEAEALGFILYNFLYGIDGGRK